jgi:hypothetical protein
LIDTVTFLLEETKGTIGIFAKRGRSVPPMIPFTMELSETFLRMHINPELSAPIILFMPCINQMVLKF